MGSRRTDGEGRAQRSEVKLEALLKRGRAGLGGPEPEFQTTRRWHGALISGLLRVLWYRLDTWPARRRDAQVT